MVLPYLCTVIKTITIMIHEFKSQSGRVFTAEKNNGKYIINGCAVAEKNFCWFGANGIEAEKLCANIGAPKSASVKIVLDRAEFSRLMAAFAREEQEVLSGLPLQYRIEDIFVDADGDKVAIGKKITEYKVDESGNEHVIIIRQFKNNELDGQDITEKNMAEIIERVYAIREDRKNSAASKEQEYEITYHGDHEMWNGVRMD